MDQPVYQPFPSFYSAPKGRQSASRMRVNDKLVTAPETDRFCGQSTSGKPGKASNVFRVLHTTLKQAVKDADEQYDAHPFKSVTCGNMIWGIRTLVYWVQHICKALFSAQRPQP